MATTREKERRDSILVLLLILLIGFLCIILASGWALRFAPNWKLNANMNSKLDPNSEFVNSQSLNNYLAPLDPGILTKPAWLSVFLTPNAVFSTGTIPPTKTSTLPPTSTPKPNTPTPVPATVTATVYIPPYLTATKTPVPAVPPTSTNTPVPLVPVDLSISKTDGSGTYTAGTAISYTIAVGNAGPSNATGAKVTDAIPAAINGVSINCAASGSASCGTNASAGNNLSFTGVSISAGAGNFITITVNGTVSAAATGNLVNTATVSAGAGQTDVTPGNNSATDTDTSNAQTDLGITKTDGSATYTAGAAVTYTIVVTNAGPSNATGATVADTFPAQITSATWTCVAAGGASCAASGSGNLNNNVNIPVGGSVTYTMIANTSASASGIMSNTATVAAGAGQTDPTPGNNSATDIPADTPAYSADLSITNTDNATAYIGGIAVQYIVTASNAGPSNVTGATFTDTFSMDLDPTTVNWTCSGSGGASCTTSGSGGNITDNLVNLPAGSSVTYVVNANVVASPSDPTNTLTSTATISITGGTTPAGVTDPTPGNNSVTDTDVRVIPDAVPPGLEVGTGPNGTVYNLLSGSQLTLGLTITVNGHPSWDLVYYEFPAGSGVLLDWMIVQVGDGKNWYTVFYWGNNVADTNTNMDFNILPFPTMPPFPPPEEPDQRDIPTASLYNGTGIGINLDGVVPPGTYSYVRFFAPPGDVDGHAEIDAVQALP